MNQTGGNDGNIIAEDSYDGRDDGNDRDDKRND